MLFRLPARMRYRAQLRTIIRNNSTIQSRQNSTGKHAGQVWVYAASLNEAPRAGALKSCDFFSELLTLSAG